MPPSAKKRFGKNVGGALPQGRERKGKKFFILSSLLSEKYWTIFSSFVCVFPYVLYRKRRKKCPISLLWPFSEKLLLGNDDDWKEEKKRKSLILISIYCRVFSPNPRLFILGILSRSNPTDRPNQPALTQENSIMPFGFRGEGAGEKTLVIMGRWEKWMVFFEVGGFLRHFLPYF